MNDQASEADWDEDDGPNLTLLDILTWLGEGKWLLAALAALGLSAALAFAFFWPPTYTARTTLLPPGAQQQSGSAAALATLGALGALPGGLGGKTPDELYVALLRSDSVVRALDQRFKLQQRYEVSSFERLRSKMASHVSVGSDKRSGVITVEVDDRDPAFAAELANAHATEAMQVLDRLAVGEAKQRRLFYEQQLNATKERLVQAEQSMRQVQERSGVIVLDKQAEALIGGAAQLRAMIAEREVQLKVLKTGATDQNPEVIRMNSELSAMREELARLEARRPARAPVNGANGANGDASALDIPVARLPEAAIDFIRARRELKLQETLLENMIRQYEVAKLDEAKEGQVLQQIDRALPPDFRSFPPRMIVVVGGLVAGLMLGAVLIVVRRYGELVRSDPRDGLAWNALGRAWRLRG